MPPTKHSRTPFDPGAPGPGASTPFERAARVAAPSTVRGREIVHEISNGRVVPRGIVSGAAPPIERAPAGAPGLVTATGGGMHTPLTPGRRVGEDVGGRTSHTPLSRGFTPFGPGAGPELPAERARNPKPAGSSRTRPAGVPVGGDVRARPPAAPGGCGCGGPCGCAGPAEARSDGGSGARAPASTPHRRFTHRPGKTGPRADWYDADAEAEWKDKSRALYAARMMGLEDWMTPALLKAARAEPDTPFAPLYALWALDNHAMEGRHAEALAVADEWERLWPDAELRGRTLLPGVLGTKAEMSRMLGDGRSAERALQRRVELERAVGLDTADTWYALGALAEEYGDKSKARQAYLQAAQAPGERPIPATAARNARRLTMRVDWTRSDPSTLAAELLRALQRGDADALASLASKSHFALAQAGGHKEYTEPAVILPALLRDVRSSRVYGNPARLEGSGAKRYLSVLGWRGSVFSGRTWFLLSQREGMWEWSGVGTELRLPETNDLHRRVLGSPIHLPNDPMDVAIKAPFPAGFSMQAGGVGLFLAMSILGGIDGAARFLAAGTATAALEPFLALSRAIIGDRPCGFGPGGFYYNTPNEHVVNRHEFRSALGADWSDDQYAIDFTRWERGNAYPDNLSKNIPVVACADGVVLNLWPWAGTGTEGRENFVDHRLVTGWPGDTPYTARYLHLDGPYRLTVSAGMWVQQGFVLGRINDTGSASFHDHLHFEMHDHRVRHETTLPGWGPRGSPYGRSVRPTPMDGQSLNDDDDGRCITSTNAITNPRAYCELLMREAGLDVGLCRATYGADPAGLQAGADYVLVPHPASEDLSVRVDARAYCEYLAARAPASVRDDILAICRSIRPGTLGPALHEPVLPPPSETAQPRAYCFWRAGMISDPTLAAEVRRFCQAMPPDPPFPPAPRPGRARRVGGVAAPLVPGAVGGTGRVVPDPATQPRAYCFWRADQIADPAIAEEARRFCRALPEDPR